MFRYTDETEACFDSRELLSREIMLPSQVKLSRENMFPLPSNELLWLHGAGGSCVTGVKSRKVSLTEVCALRKPSLATMLMS